MKALVYSEPFRLDIRDIPVPAVGPADVLVQVKSVGICGSDVMGYTGRTGRRIPPLVMGHEASGLIAEVGAQVRGVKPGDRVCFDSTMYCNQCAACRAGHHNYCRKREVLGVSVPGMRRQGAMAEFVRIPGWAILPMPENLSFTEAALLEPVAIGLHGVARARTSPGETVLIIGSGTIGLFILQATRLRGPGKIIVLDLNEHRLSLARSLGADVVASPESIDPLLFVQQETAGAGADVSFEVVGLEATLGMAIRSTRIGGRVVLLGNLTRNPPVDIQDIVSRELTLLGSYASAGEYSEAVDLVARGVIDPRPLISAVLPLEQGPEAFDRLYRGEEKALVKIVLRP